MVTLRLIGVTSAVLLGAVAATSNAQELRATEVRVDSAAAYTALARAGFEIATVRERPDGSYAVIVTTAAQRVALGLEGFVVRVAPPAVRRPPVVFPTLARIDSLLSALASTRAHVALDTIGTSFEGRPIVAVKIGPTDDTSDRPNVLFIATHHAREWISTIVALRLIQWLADSLAVQDAPLLAQRDVWVVPVLNPDGYAFTFSAERLWRKNRRTNADGTVGVDLNRNYPAFWGRDDIGSSGIPTAETYRGTRPASEPEVAALIAFHDRHPPDLAVSYHSFTDLILYPYGHAPGRLAPDHTVFQALAGTPLAPAVIDGLPESARRAYHAGPGWQLYPTNGEYTEWAYRAHGTIAFTVELTAGCCVNDAGYGFEFPDDSAAVAQVFQDNLPFVLAVLEAAGNLERARGPSGITVGPPAIESMWPRLRIVGPPDALTIPLVHRVAGTERLLAASADSLNRGRVRWRWESDAAAEVGTEIEVPGLNVRASLLYREGAEDTVSGWSGWRRDSSLALEGRAVWFAERDTLLSPEFDLSGVTAPQLVFWNRHGGSLFLPDRRGLVEYSEDGGLTWQPVAQVEGAGGDWYPVHVSLPEGSPRARLRLIADNMPWLVDAIQVFGTLPAVRAVVASGELAISENPVRSDRLFLSWAPESGDATLTILTFAGDVVYRETTAAADGQLLWDLVNQSGARVENGAYIAVLELPAVTLRRRVFVARGP